MWGGRETNVEKALRIKHFGRYTVLERSNKGSLWVVVECSCGTVKDIRASELISGATKSCGCLQKELSAKRMSERYKGKYEDLTGRVFGRLTALAFTGKSGGKDRKSTWLCRCECGVEKSYDRTVLIAGTTQSCGCLQRELVAKRMTKHGYANHPLYRTWSSMLDRCTNPKNPQYSNYGGRGISVCEEWSDPTKGIENFIKDMGDKPSEDHSIDRIDVDGNYEPQNCRWATTREQMLNTRKSLLKNSPWAFKNVKTGKWYGCIIVEGKQKRFKDCDTPEEASLMVYKFLTEVLKEPVDLQHDLIKRGNE